jgi:UDP-N-acetylglucosamine diphosphorylase/glucosamine-1-phosphate N-acetyltransferase
MKILLDDFNQFLKFAPLTFTRPIGNLRCGILTNDERWKKFMLDSDIYFKSESYLNKKFICTDSPDISVNACLIPNKACVEAILKLNDNERLMHNDIILAFTGTGEKNILYSGNTPLILQNRWDLFEKNEAAIRSDFQILTDLRESAKLSSTNTIIGDPSELFIEDGAKIEGAIFNTNTGPIYIGKNAEIMEGSLIRGPFAICESAVVKMGAKIYGATTIGPHCKVGGEISNSIFQSYSNKAHDGFLGNSLIGEWCNLGADTNTSNLKNNYGAVSTYSYEENKEIKTAVTFMGLCMGDHSKCGINTMFNTASVVGVSSNIFGAGFPAKYIPSFTWGSADEMLTYRFDKAIEFANKMMERRGLSLSLEEIEILRYIHEKN